MSIEETMKKVTFFGRLSMGSAWMVWDDTEEEWVVMERKPYAKKNTCLYQGDSVELALEALEGSQE